MAYEPTPIPTQGVELAPEILALAELLAENTHDIWALERMAQGWHYGPSRSDDAKEHPCLVPYSELSESEKVFDRNTALQTLKAICALGYEIRKKTPGP